MAGSNQITIGGTVLDIAVTKRDAKRLYLRRSRPSQESDPSIPKTMAWQVSGAIGQSYESPEGYLGHDHSNLETRQEGLLTSLGALTALTISGSDPIVSGTSALGAMPLGSRALGAGTSSATPGTITHGENYFNRIFLGRGNFVTQVNPSSWTVEETENVSATVRGMAEWFGKLRIGLGVSKAIQTVTGVSSTGATYSDTQVSGSDTNAREMRVIGDKLWWNRANDSTDDNRLRYTADDFSSQSTGFRVGDRGVAGTGIGVVDGAPVNGTETGPVGFTEDGANYPIGFALKDAKSDENGRQWAVGPDGWAYMISRLTLYALKGGAINPVGIGTESMAGFDGFDGRPVAIKAWRDVVYVAYEDSAGTTWRILSGHFNPAKSGGELDWHPFQTRTNAAIRWIGATPVPTLPHIVWGEGANTLCRTAKGRGGRDMSDASYTYSTSGGVWYGSRSLRSQHTRKTVRWGRFFTEDTSGNGTWTLAVAMDGGSYANVGSAVSTNGTQKVVPSTLTSAPTGFTIKPRLTQTSSSSTTPPKVRGVLEIGYDERPDTVTQIEVSVKVSAADLVTLRTYHDGENSAGRNVVTVILPDDAATYYGFVNRVDEEDREGEIVTAALTLSLVEAS